MRTSLSSTARYPLIEKPRNIAIIITGCLSDSPGLHNVYVLNLVDVSGLEVRVGYFGKFTYDIEIANLLTEATL